MSTLTPLSFPQPPPSLRTELFRPYIYLPLFLSLALLLLSLWDQSRIRLSILSPVLFLWSTILLPLPTWAHLLWLAARAAWGYYDDYRELIRVTIYESVAFLLLLPVLPDVRLAVHTVLPLLPLRAARKSLELRISWGWALAQLAKGAQGALGWLAGVSSVSGDAYRKALQSEGDRKGFLGARLDSLLRPPSLQSPEDASPSTQPSPDKKKLTRPRRLTANPYSLTPPSPPNSTLGKKYRVSVPVSPPSSDRELESSGSASALESFVRMRDHEETEKDEGCRTPEERRYPRRTKRSVDLRTPEPVVKRESVVKRELVAKEKDPRVKKETEEMGKELEEVKREESPVKRGRGRPRKNV